LQNLKVKVEALSDGNVFQLEALEYLNPFLEVIKSEETSGHITALALDAIQKFIAKQFLGPLSSNPAKGIRHIVQAVSLCRFSGSDPVTDELVLMKILNVLLVCLQSPAGHLLSNKLVFEMIQTCFKMSKQTRLSMLLRKAAEKTLQDMVQCVFSRHYTNDKETGFNVGEKGDKDSNISSEIGPLSPRLEDSTSSVLAENAVSEGSTDTDGNTLTENGDDKKTRLNPYPI